MTSFDPNRSRRKRAASMANHVEHDADMIAAAADAGAPAATVVSDTKTFFFFSIAQRLF